MRSTVGGARRSHRTGRWVGLLAATVVGLLALLPAPAASAHAFLESSSPADGEVLTAAPAEIRLRFSESVVLQVLVIDLADGHGRHFRPTAVHLATAAADGEEPDTEEPAEVVAALPPLARDAYRLSWQTLSADDLHRTSGVLVFGIGQSVTAAGAAEPAPRPEEALLRAALFLSLALAVGGLLAGRLWGRALERDPDPGGPAGQEADAAAVVRCRRWAAWGAFAGLVSSLGLFLDQLTVGGLGPADLLATGLGWRSAVRLVGFAALLVASTARFRDSRVRVWIAGAGAAAVGVGTALLGHAGAGAGPVGTAVLADAAHVLAAAIWIGTLLVACLVIVPRARRQARPAVATMLRTFGPLAAVCVGVMAVTGLYLGSSVVGSVDALLLTFYGRTLLAKLAVVGVIGVLALINHRRLRSKSASPLPRTTLVAEATAAVVVVLLAGVLTSSQPAREPEYVRAAPLATVPVTDGLAVDLQEAVSVRPNVPGRNVVLIDVFDTRRPTRGPVRVVWVDLGGAGGRRVEATKLGEGHYSVNVTLEASGALPIAVTVQRAGLPDVVSQYSWTVGRPAGPTRLATVSDTPIGGLLAAASLVLLALLLVLVGAILAHRQYRRRGVAQPPGGSHVEPAESGDPPQWFDDATDGANPRSRERTFENR